jgi:hypothetical protein
MASTIQLKTGTGSAKPTSLSQGEIAINVDNGLVFTMVDGTGKNPVTKTATVNLG